MSPLDSLDVLQFVVQAGVLAPLPTDLNDVVATMEITGNRSLHFAVSVWSMDSSVAPPGCPTPRIGTLTPEQNQSRFNVAQKELYHVLGNCNNSLFVHSCFHKFIFRHMAYLIDVPTLYIPYVV